MSTRPSHNRTTFRKGAILVLITVLMIGLLGMVAFAVDIGYMLCARTEAQRAVDSGALAGAGAIGEGYVAADQVAREFVRENLVGGQTPAQEEIQIHLGQWDSKVCRFGAATDRASAVRVELIRRNQPLFFARVFGQDRFTVRASAVAT